MSKLRGYVLYLWATGELLAKDDSWTTRLDEAAILRTRRSAVLLRRYRLKGLARGSVEIATVAVVRT